MPVLHFAKFYFLFLVHYFLFACFRRASRIKAKKKVAYHSKFIQIGESQMDDKLINFTSEIQRMGTSKNNT
jgi:hypothetical protein